MNRKHLIGALVAIVAVSSALVVGATLLNGGPVSGEVTLVSPDGPAVTLSGSTDANLTAPFPDNETVKWETSAGNATFFSSARTNVTIAPNDLEGTWTNATAIDATAANLTIDPTDKPAATVGGGVTAISFRGDINVTDDDVAFVYSANSSGTITVRGLQAGENFTAATTDGTLVDNGTVSASGTATIAVGSATDTEIVLFQNVAPSVNESAASPENETLSSRDITLSVPVSDLNFDDSVGDEVTVDFYVDGAKVATETTTQDDTVSTTVSLTDGGEHNWSVVASDDYGAAVNSKNFTFSLPSELKIYNESAPSELVDNATVKIQFYFEDSDDLVVTRNSTDGTVNLSGLPVNEPFVVVARGDGYLSRRIYVESLTEQQSIYLLPEDENFVETRFVLEDFTGLYQKEETVLVVQRAINDSWTNVESDFFGATGTFPTQLERDVRHRLILVNTESGSRRPLGTFTPLRSGEQTVEVLSLAEIQVRRQEPEVDFAPGLSSLRAESKNLTVGVTERSDPVTSWSVEIQYVAQNGSTTTLETYSASEPSEVTREVNLSGRAGGEVRVIVDWETEGGRSATETKNYSVRSSYGNKHSFLNVLGGITARLPASNAGVFASMLSVLLTTLGTAAVGARYRLSTEQSGLVALLFMFAFGIVGWIGWALVFAATVAWVAVAAIRRGL